MRQRSLNLRAVPHCQKDGNFLSNSHAAEGGNRHEAIPLGGSGGNFDILDALRRVLGASSVADRLGSRTEWLYSRLRVRSSHVHACMLRHWTNHWETDAHALSVPRRGRSAPSRPGQADPRQQARAGGHHPAPASDRMPQERDPSAALVGSRSRQAGPRRQQDGPQDRSPQYPGPAHSRTPAARRKPVRLSVPERSRRPRSRNLPFWYRARREAGFEDVRLHDLRHSHASHAVMNGVPVPVVSRLLGHSDVRSTLRYAHLGDREIEAAAERVGQSIAAVMGL